MSDRDYSHFIAVTNRALCRGDFLGRIEAITDGTGLRGVILREKDLPEEEYRDLASAVLKICRAHGVPLFLHSRVSLARELGCEGLHLSIPALRDLLSGPEGKEALRSFREVSVSCHSKDDVQEAVAAGATMIILGTIFETDCKKGLKGRGTDFIRSVTENCPIPVYAIGGIKESNLGDVLAAGAAGGCMMSGFMA